MSQEKYLYCPKCGCEYREGCEICADCNLPLTDKKPDILIKDDPYSDEWVKLLDDIGDIEADMTISLLSYYNIQAKKFYRGETQYISLFMGALGSGVYVIVKKGDLDEAQKILKASDDVDNLYE